MGWLNAHWVQNRVLSLNVHAALQILYTPLIIYIPSLAFSQGAISHIDFPASSLTWIFAIFAVSGINLYVVAVATCAICIFYTSLVSN